MNQSPDVLVIGGGITGCGIARELAYRGVSVLVIDKGDLGSGTSSVSSKLVHGGIRYLEHGAFRLVADACRERYWLTQTAPHLVRPQSFVLPVYQDDLRPKWMIRLGIMAYEWASLGYRIGQNYMISVADALRQVPLLNPTGLVGAAHYVDGIMDDARLVIEVAMHAVTLGAEFYPYTPMIDCQRHTSGYRVTVKRLDETVCEVTPRFVVNASGPWVDGVARQITGEVSGLLRPTKGVHLVTRPLGTDTGLLMNGRDGRVMFMVPKPGYCVVGTTDTPVETSIDDRSVTPREVAYLIEAVHRTLSIRLDACDIYGVFAGFRPLAQSSATTPAAISRDQSIVSHGPYAAAIFGGKYTTFRLMAEDMAKHVMGRLGRRFDGSTRNLLIPPSMAPSLTEWDAFTDYTITHEFATQLDDVMRRRSHLWFSPDNGNGVLPIVADTMAGRLGWTAIERDRQVSAYRLAQAKMQQVIGLGRAEATV